MNKSITNIDIQKVPVGKIFLIYYREVYVDGPGSASALLVLFLGSVGPVTRSAV